VAFITNREGVHPYDPDRNEHRAGLSKMKRKAGITSGYRGFTLLELMVTITVFGVLTALAVPSFTTMNNRNKLAAESNELLAAVQYARMEAIRTSATVTVCGTASADADEDSDCESGEQPFWVVIGSTTGGGQEQLRSYEVREPLKVSTDLESVTFSADGLARDSANALLAGEITVCLETTRPAQNKRVLNIASGSRMAITTPTEDGGGTCT
jgi:type IV fimbrial biogenesis protein FimT